jgi:hypothetical protein
MINHKRAPFGLIMQENVNSMANIFLSHVLKSHRAMLAPFIIPKVINNSFHLCFC